MVNSQGHEEEKNWWYYEAMRSRKEMTTAQQTMISNESEKETQSKSMRSLERCSKYRGDWEEENRHK